MTFKIWDVWTVVGGLGDLFISLMLWHILDFKSKADLIKSGESVFEIKQVIATNGGINDYNEDDLIFEKKSVDKKR